MCGAINHNNHQLSHACVFVLLYTYVYMLLCTAALARTAAAAVSKNTIICIYCCVLLLLLDCCRSQKIQSILCTACCIELRLYSAAAVSSHYTSYLDRCLYHIIHTWYGWQCCTAAPAPVDYNMIFQQYTMGLSYVST